MTVSDDGIRRVLLSTDDGDMTIAVDGVRAPASAGYFLGEVRAGRFDGTSFYRIATLANQEPGQPAAIEIVQGGGRQPLAPTSPIIPHESTRDTGLRHRRGAISLGRFAPGAVYGGFFLCASDQPALDFGGGRQPDGQGFAAFGMIAEGLDLLDRLFARAESQEILRHEIPIRRIILL
ncbi:peptidylprolyl isomerase [Rhizorhabdus wittichii]|uniref:Peptidylprolyl isomerase n=1 Tax=Rhizorhabdus wittichii TaxID=160791 RepID=A0A975D247_9SPHN|nr:peptidylprolyl isomerase [Rhizorhabdus wittichii]QTH21489.1 peptidylprolyl isomerase [Rhizorhabdus wittichii]